MKDLFAITFAYAGIFAAKIFRKMKTVLYNIGDNLLRIAVAIVGAIWGYLLPTLPFAAICFFAIILDSITAFRLAKRVHKRYPKRKVIDKFRSDKAYAIFPTLLVVYSCVVLGYMIDKEIFPFLDMYLANTIAGGFCLWEMWSILENESSECDQSWAKFLQKFMVNKASRHIEDFYETWHGMDSTYEGKQQGVSEEQYTEETI